MTFVKIPSHIIQFSEDVQKLCLKKGGSFRNGCPNYNKKSECPPNQPLINKILDFSKSLYVIYTEFNVEEFADKMRSKYPDWTEKACFNPRYWQPKARKEHAEEIRKFLDNYDNLIFNKTPEAHGVNVHNLMVKIGVALEWPPRKLTRIVSLAGSPYRK